MEITTGALENGTKFRTLAQEVEGTNLQRALCAAAAGIGLIVLWGYATANREVAALGAHKPAAAVSALMWIAMSASVAALSGHWKSRLVLTRFLAAFVVVVAAAELMVAGWFRGSDSWQRWGTSGSVALHPYLVTSFLCLLLAIALYLLTTPRTLTAHVLASIVLLLMNVVLLGYFLGIEAFPDPAQHIVPVPATAAALAIVALAQVIAGRVGWIHALLSRTSAGSMARVLLPAVMLVPLISAVICDLAAHEHQISATTALTIIVSVNVALGVGIVLGTAIALYRHEIERERLAVIVDSCSDAIISLSPEGLIRSWNRGAEQLCGYAVREMRGCSIRRLFPADHGKELSEWIDVLSSGGCVLPAETIWLTRDGEERNVLLTLSPMLEPSGGLAGISIVARDMTARALAASAIEHARNTIRRSGERLQAIVDSLKESIATIDTQFRFIAFNQRFVEEFHEYAGIKPASGMNLLDCLRHLPKEQNVMMSRWRRALAGEEFEIVEEVGDEQNPRLLEIRYSSLRTPDGILLGATCVGRDVTERIRAQRDLARSLQEVGRLATVIEQAGESIMITDVEGRIEYVNPAFERITGYSRAEVIGERPSILKSGRQDESFYRTLWQTIRRGDIWSGHFMNKRRDGSHYEEEATISPIRSEEGSITHFAAIKRDVTVEVALEEQLRHAQKIEAIGTLAGGVAHDFNNLLQAMLTIVQIVQRKNDTASEHMRQLEKTIRRGSQLTKQLLLFARREKNSLRDIDLAAVIEEMSVFLGRVVRENIHLTIDAPTNPVVVRADRGQIEQVIVNLAVNAMDAMPDGGRLTLALRREEDRAVLLLKDTGPGIPEEIRGRIFEPFFTTKDAGRGTGLGLSVVHGIVTAHGGTIAVECPAGGGTLFQITFPLQHNIADPECGELSGEVSGNGERVLLVEDEPSVREGLSIMLSLLGYEVTAASNAAEALELAQRETFRIVVTDYMLPDRPGLEIVRALHAEQPEVKAILMSGYAAPGSLEEAISANELRFLQKPFSSTELARALA